MSVLDPVGDVTAYRHVGKLAQPKSSITLGGTVLKWYDIASEEAPVPIAIRALARRNLRDAMKAGTLGISGDFGFVILHRCERDFYFLLLSTWRNENELWETVWAKVGDADMSFHSWSVEEEHRPTFCVWELGAVWHEQQAWIRFLSSSRDGAAKYAYLRDMYDGVV